MRYVCGVLLPVMSQALLVATVVAMYRGSGSFVGLGVFLLACLAIPITAMVCAWYTKIHPQLSLRALLIHGFVIALI